ncbi:MAG: hypothetical protein GWP91_23925, partial [Rhodobacterales bacterium]|nr:hypothetical protein [Rhodobacterales bacterium]
ARVAAEYGTGSLAMGVGAITPVLPFPTIDIEAAYRRVPSQDANEQKRLEIFPISALAEWTINQPEGNSELFLGVGPSFMGFAETHPYNEVPIRGTKITAESRFGGRINTGLVQPRAWPAPRGLHALELEIYGARRIQFSGPAKGFVLGAWRGSVGIVFRT